MGSLDRALVHLEQGSPVAEDPWYTSGTFWTVVGIIVTALFGAGAIVASYRSANPRRRLYVYATATTRLVHRHGTALDLEVRHQGAVLSDPHLITLHLVSRGRRDILKEQFADPITLQLHVPLVELLESTSSVKSGAVPAPTRRILADRIEVGPALIGRDQRISYTVLVDGEPRLDPLCPLGNVDVLLVSPETPRPRPVLVAGLVAFGCQILGGVSASLGMWVLGYIAVTGAILSTAVLARLTIKRFLQKRAAS